MLFNSGQFLIYFPIVVLLYFILPKKLKNLWLLIASYYFYMCWSVKYVLLIVTSTVVTWFSGIIMEKIKDSDRDEEAKVKLKKWTVAGSFIINLGILGYFKYMNFFLDTIARVFSLVHINISVPVVDILLPVGISFYTFQALSYTMDVYRGDIYAEKNILQYALFVSFFPQLVAGPIERSKNLLKQLAVPKKFDFENFREGFLLMLWGYFLKIVIADRAAIIADKVFSDIDTYGGWFISIAIIIFTLQIYCDFYGYSIIAKGAAKFLGIDLMENFQSPFMQTSIANHWRNWHISLTSWFRDYLYIPLGGNRKGTARKYLNILIVFAVSGLWHGASLTYLVWGSLHGIYQIIGGILMPVRKKICEVFDLDREALGHRILLMIGTFLLIAFGFIIFRAPSMGQAMAAYKSMFTVHNPWILFDGSLYSLGVNQKNFSLLIACFVILGIADICKLNNICISKLILKQNMWCRVAIIGASIIFILLFGIWGPAYDAANFIYFQF